MFNNAVYRRLPHDLEAREYMFRKAFDGLKSISIKGVQKMAELNRIEWGGGIDEKIPFKGSEIYNLADEITRYVAVGWK